MVYRIYRHSLYKRDFLYAGHFGDVILALKIAVRGSLESVHPNFLFFKADTFYNLTCIEGLIFCYSYT